MRVRRLGRVEYLPTYQAMQDFTARRGEDTEDELWLCEHPPVFTQGLAGKPEHVLAPGDIPVVPTNRGGQVTYHGPGQVVAYPLLDLKRAGYFVKEYVYRLEEAAIRTLAEFGVTGHRVAGAPGIYVRRDDPFSHARLPPPQPSPKGGGSEGMSPAPPGGGSEGMSPASPEGGSEGMFPASLGGGSEGMSPPPLGEGQGGGTPADPFHNLAKIAALGVKISRHHSYHGLALNVAMDLEPFSRINPCGYAKLETTDLSTIGVSVSWNDAAEVLGHKLGALLAP